MGLGDETQVVPGLAASAFNPLNHLTDSEKHFLKYLAGLGMGLTGRCPPKMHGALGSRLSNTKQREKSKYLAHRKQNISLLEITMQSCTDL